MRTSAQALAAAVTLASGALAADRTTWQGEALVTDPTQECTYYNYAPVTDVIGTYPPIWATAVLNFTGVLASDVAVYNSFSSGIPDIAPRGTRAGDFTGVNYNSSDPYCWWSWNKCTTPKLAGLEADVSTCAEPNTWGFTLDDGPNCSHNAYYDYLNTIEQKATLFYIGSNVVDWPLEAQRGLGDGHEICAHTWSHPYMTSMTNEEAFAELYYAKKAIKEVLGITVTCWRPPYGDVDDRIRYIASKLNLRTIIWDADTFDYDYSTLGVSDVEANYQALLTAQANGTYNTHGTIVLSHELDNETMALSEKYLPQIRAAFSGGVMPVGSCLNTTSIYGESGYEYPNYAQWVAGTRSISLLAPTAATTDVAFATNAVVTSSGGAASAATTSGASSATSSAKSTSSTKASAAVSTASSATSAAASAATSAAASGALGLNTDGLVGVFGATVLAVIGAALYAL